MPKKGVAGAVPVGAGAAVAGEKGKLATTLNKHQTEWDGLRQKLEGPNRNADANQIGQFPVQYFQKHEGEETIAAYRELQEKGLYGASENALFNKTSIPDEVRDYIVDKRESEQLRLFEEWLNKTYDMGNPLEVNHLRSLYPAFFEKRIQQVEKDADMMKRLARIRIQGGPQTTEDLYLMFAIQSELIDLSQIDSTLWNPTPYDGGADKKIVERGLFNPLRWASNQQWYKTTNRADPFKSKAAGVTDWATVGKSGGHADLWAKPDRMKGLTDNFFKKP
jgi:hypothetical protein